MHHQTSSPLRLHPQPNSDISPRSVVSKGTLPTYRHPHQLITHPHHDQQPSNPSSRQDLPHHNHSRPTQQQQQTQHNPRLNQHPPDSHATVGTNPTHQQYCHLFQPILSPSHTIIPRPYVPAPRPHDAEGHPWCACCTAQLSDDDLHSPGLRDPAHPNIRYRLRRDEDLPPTHSNLHNDLTHIHRINADYHRSQRETKEAQQAITGNLQDYLPTTSYTNTPAATNLQRTTQHFQFERYQRRGGLLP